MDFELFGSHGNVEAGWRPPDQLTNLTTIFIPSTYDPTII